jgi:hypothetical protein
MSLITQVTSLDTFSMLLKRFVRSGFFNFGNKSKSGGLRRDLIDLSQERESLRASVNRVMNLVFHKFAEVFEYLEKYEAYFLKKDSAPQNQVVS